MYHCHVHFCLSGYTCNTFEIVKEISPFEHFTHEFFEKENPEAEAVAKADVIMLHLQDQRYLGYAYVRRRSSFSLLKMAAALQEE